MKISFLRPAAATAICLAVLIASAAEPAGPGVRVEIKDDKGTPVADAVASLTPLDRSPLVTPPTDPVTILQKGEEFQPYVTPVVAGTRVRFPNEDAVQHHVFSLSKIKRFDLQLYRGEPREPVLFDQPGVVSLGCNIHDWMSAYVVVLATPHFAKSGADGRATIGALPPGRYRLDVWHPRLRALDQREITVTADPSTQVISVMLSADRRIRRAPDAGSGSYP